MSATWDTPQHDNSVEMLLPSQAIHTQVRGSLLARSYSVHLIVRLPSGCERLELRALVELGHYYYIALPK